MTVFLVWVGDADAAARVPGEPGPWREVRTAAPGLLLVDSADTLSRVYHEVKWLLPDDCPLTAVAVESRPKSRGLAAGSVAWVRDRVR